MLAATRHSRAETINWPDTSPFGVNRCTVFKSGDGGLGGASEGLAQPVGVVLGPAAFSVHLVLLLLLLLPVQLRLQRLVLPLLSQLLLPVQLQL